MTVRESDLIMRGEGSILTPSVLIHRELLYSISEASFFDNDIRKQLNWGKWLWYHTHNSKRSNAGFPDIVAIKDGALLAIELKREQGRVSPDQRVWLAAMATVGAECYVWRPSNSIEAQERLLRGMLK